MYNLFYYNISKMTDEIYNKEFLRLSKIKQKEIAKKANFEDRKRSVAGIMLTRKTLSKIYGINEDEIAFAKGEHGKPYVLNIPAHFNLSHSGKYVVLAVSDAPIGVDTEEIREFSAILAKKIFNQEELDYIAGNGPARTKSKMQQCFYELWTAKEAYLKYLGMGLSGGIKSLTLKCTGKITPNDNSIKLTYDYSVPGAVTAIITPKT